MEGDKESIRKLHLEAFGQAEGDIVSQLAIDLLEDETAQPVLSLVAEQDQQIIGNVIFSKVIIENAEALSVYILAPLAIANNYQGKGTGTKLVKQGLEMLKARGVEIVLVLGDPGYYTRTGFSAGHHLRSPYELDYPEAWMAQELVEGVLEKTRGRVRCASSLHSPELW